MEAIVSSSVCGLWSGRNRVLHFSFQGAMVSFCRQNCKMRCSFDETMDWIDLKIL